MVEREIEIVNQLGLHARAAAKVVHLASRFSCQVKMQHRHQDVDAKSILGLLLLAAPLGSHVTISCDGEDELDALDQLTELISNRFGEET